MIRRLAIAATLALFAVASTAKDAVYSTGDGAIRGYDPVAYFVTGAPQRGRDDLRLDWNGATWHFANAENLAAFRADPERYAPQYGGYCAWAVANGYTASIDPDAWAIVDDRLFLNYSKGVQRQWQEDVPGNIARGDRNWPQVLSK